MKKRVLSLALAVLMLLSLFPASALAEEAALTDELVGDGVLDVPVILSGESEANAVEGAVEEDSSILAQDDIVEEAPVGDGVLDVPVILSGESEANEAEGSSPEEQDPSPEAQNDLGADAPVAGDDSPGVPETVEEPAGDEAASDETPEEAVPDNEEAFEDSESEEMSEEPSAASAAETEPTALYLNTPTQAVIANDDEWAYFSFTPTETGDYLFYSSQEYMRDWLTGAVYDSNWKQLKEITGNCLEGNFTLRCTLTAGEAYYFAARYLAINVTGSFPVELRAADFYAEAEVSSIGVAPGQKATMRVNATGDVSYQWYKDGGWYSDTLIEGETSNTFATEVSGYEDYFCYVCGPSGVGEGIPFSLHVDNKLKAYDVKTNEKYPSILVTYGESLTMTIQVDCIDSQDLSITWEADGKTLATNCTSYSVPQVTRSTTYYVTVCDRFGTHAYVDYRVNIDNELSLSLNDDNNTSIQAEPGECVPLKIHVSARNMDNIKIVWERLTHAGGYSYSDGVVAEDVDQVVTPPLETSLTYLCTVTDCYNNSTSLWIDINIQNHLEAVPVIAEQYVPEGEMVTFAIRASADDMTGLHYYWEEVYHYDDGTVSFFSVADSDTDSITVGPMKDRMMHYNCIVTDKFGTQVSGGFWAYPMSEFHAELNKNSLTLAVTKTAKLSVIDTKYNEEAWASWESADPSIASVNGNGVVTANHVGKTTITATHYGVKMSCEVTVLFSDVVDSGKYYFNPVYWAAENGITVGYSDGSFGVDRDCQRRELMIFLWRYAGCPETDADGNAYGDARNMFNDLSGYGLTSATNKAIAWAYSEGITKGYNDGGFHPEASIVRKDVMIMLYRLAGKPDVSGRLSFTDCQGYQQNSDTYKAILWGSQNGITKGYSEGPYKGQFGSNLNCLREQIVTFLYRYKDLG